MTDLAPLTDFQPNSTFELQKRHRLIHSILIINFNKKRLSLSLYGTTSTRAFHYMILSHRGRVAHKWVSEICHHWFSRHVAYSPPRHHLNRCWFVVNWNLGNKLQWNFNFKPFHSKNAFKNVVCKNDGHFLSASICLNCWYGQTYSMWVYMQFAWNTTGSSICMEFPEGYRRE